jgi:hypothetical protein
MSIDLDRATDEMVAADGRRWTREPEPTPGPTFPGVTDPPATEDPAASPSELAPSAPTGTDAPSTAPTSNPDMWATHQDGLDCMNREAGSSGGYEAKAGPTWIQEDYGELGTDWHFLNDRFHFAEGLCGTGSAVTIEASMVGELFTDACHWQGTGEQGRWDFVPDAIATQEERRCASATAWRGGATLARARRHRYVRCMAHDGAPFDGTELGFWLGEWDLTWEGGHGTNRISRTLRDRVILEEFEEASDSGSATDGGADALHGRSWSVFDPDRRLWRQTWVDDQGSYLDLVGGRAEGCFTFERAAPERGDRARQRMVFRDVTPEAFRWTWESSPDDGATWILRWAIDYRRRGAS